MFAFENSLHATPEQFSWAIAIFYVGYGLAEIPSIMALLYLTPKNWLPASMFIWYVPRSMNEKLPMCKRYLTG